MPLPPQQSSMRSGDRGREAIVPAFTTVPNDESVLTTREDSQTNCDFPSGSRKLAQLPTESRTSGEYIFMHSGARARSRVSNRR